VLFHDPSRRIPFAARLIKPVLRRLLAVGSALATMKAAPDALAQDEAEAFIPKTYPSPPYQVPTPTQYNIKLGNLEARLSASVEAEYNDNIDLAAHHPQADLSFGPDFRVGFIYPLSSAQLLQLNLGVGYRWYLHNPALSNVSLDPDTRLDYRLTIHKTFSFSFYDSFQVQTDPTVLPTLSGGAGLLDFNRFVNVAGVLARWQANEKVGLIAGYSWTYDRSLTPQFNSLDHDTHTFNAGAFYTVNPQVTVGLLAGYDFTIYRLNNQNNGSGYYFGPSLSFKPSKTITVQASVFYSIDNFAQNGLLNGGVADTSSFSGVTYQGSVAHRINKYLSQDIKASRSAELGLGSNFTDTTTLQYDLIARLRQRLSLNSTFAYQTYTASGAAGENGDLYMFYLGANYGLAPRWGLGASYALSWKADSVAANDYVQNRLTLQVTHEF
jgi:hypothetical protein